MFTVRWKARIIKKKKPKKLLTEKLPLNSTHKQYSTGVGNLLSAKGCLDIYNIIHMPYEIINWKITLL